MEKDTDERVFNVEKLESLEAESSQDLRSVKPARRGKKPNPDQLDFFAQPVFQTEEKQHADANTIPSNRENVDEHEVRRNDGDNDPQALADIRAEAGGRPVIYSEPQESPDAESIRPSRFADQSGENGEPSPVAGGDGSVEQADETLVAGNGRSGRGRRNPLQRDGL